MPEYLYLLIYANITIAVWGLAEAYAHNKQFMKLKLWEKAYTYLFYQIPSIATAVVVAYMLERVQHV